MYKTLISTQITSLAAHTILMLHVYTTDTGKDTSQSLDVSWGQSSDWFPRSCDTMRTPPVLSTVLREQKEGGGRQLAGCTPCLGTRTPFLWLLGILLLHCLSFTVPPSLSLLHSPSFTDTSVTARNSFLCSSVCLLFYSVL